jgi:hypothetical protein
VQKRMQQTKLRQVARLQTRDSARALDDSSALGTIFSPSTI